MTQSESHFDFSLQPDIDEFDPLADIEEEDEDYDEEPGALNVRDLEPEKTERLISVDNRTFSEKTADLIKSMAPQRKVLLGILSFCKDPMPVGEVNALVGKLQESNYSVFTAASLCNHLEDAGAIELVTAEGESYGEVEMEPELVVVDGVEYYETQEAPAAYWHTTEVGLEALEADRPLDRMRALFSDDSLYLPIYKEMLLLCAAEGGATAAALSEAIDGDPLVQKPRRLAPYFTERLEKCDAVEWKRAWCITEVGRKGLEELSDVEAAGAVAIDIESTE